MSHVSYLLLKYNKIFEIDCVYKQISMFLCNLKKNKHCTVSEQ